jgi:chaperone modulatory protein CbpM
METGESDKSQKIDGGAAMIGIEDLFTQIPGLERQDLERWISNDWVKAETSDGTLIFREIDVLRVKLIRDLRDDMEISEAELPVVLSLLDQLYDIRRQMRELSQAITETVPEDIRRTLLNRLAMRGPA